jgi:hypothetical protein
MINRYDPELFCPKNNKENDGDYVKYDDIKRIIKGYMKYLLKKEGTVFLDYIRSDEAGLSDKDIDFLGKIQKEIIREGKND